MSEYDRYVNLPGFDNVNRALTLFNVPVDLYRQGDGSVDAIANPDNLPMRERIGRGIESLVGTAAYALAPVLARFGGQKAAQAIPEIFTGFSGPQAAEEVVKDVVQDPSRRKFLAGAAATVPVAALAPDVITDVVTKAAKTGSRAAPINPINMAMANIRALKGQIDEKYQILDEIESSPDAANLNAKAADDAEAFIFRSQDEIVDEAINILEDMTPADLKGASDEAIEEVVSVQYDPRNGQFFDFGSLEADNLPLNPKYKMLSDEIQRRGLDKAKDRNGIDRFTHARAFVEDVNDKLNEGITFSSPNPSMQMVRETPDFVADYLNENANKIINEDIENIILDGRIDKKSTEEINKKILEYAQTNRIAAPRRAFDNPKVEYVSTKEIADNIAQFNFPRYDVGKFGGDLPTGNINESPVFQERFDKSGKPTLKEDIFNEGIKEPIEIELVLSNGEISIGQGHHRLQAAIELNLPEVPVIVKTKEMPRPLQAAAVRPGRLNTSGLELYEDYSYSDLNFSDRLIEPKETNEELFRRGGSYFLNPETNEISDRRFPDKYTPMRKGFFRRTDKKAMGGFVQGIGSLSDTARDMFRGPRGIGAYQQFTNGGGVGVDLNNFNFPPSAEDRAQANFASAMGQPDKGPVIEGIESLANVEYEADMQNALSDNVSRLGFDPDVASLILPGSYAHKENIGDHYLNSQFNDTDVIGINPRKGSSALEVQAHEYRHRGLEKLLKHFKKFPFLYKEKYGQESFDFLSKMLEQKRTDLVDRVKGKGRSYPYSEYLHENFAEMFEQDYEQIVDRYHQAEDGRVLVEGIHYGPGKEFKTLDDWKKANPGVDLQLRVVKQKNRFETPDVIKFRDYRVQRDRGELKEKIPKFEAVLQIQEAAGDLLKEIKEGKHKELFSN